MADGKDGKYLTRILSMKGYRHTGGNPEDKMRRVLATNALLAAVKDVCAEWIKVHDILKLIQNEVKEVYNDKYNYLTPDKKQFKDIEEKEQD